MIFFIETDFVGCQAGGIHSCKNSGSCSLNNECICLPEYTGQTCETYLGCNGRGPCACANGAMCLSNGICVCKIGYLGKKCDTFIGCLAGGSLICLNGGTCRPNGHCECPLYGLSGPTCSNKHQNISHRINLCF